MATRSILDWSKSYQIVPQDHIISHRYSKSKPFIPSYEKTCSPIDMNLLLGWEYARVWQREHDEYLHVRKMSEQVKVVKRVPYKKKPKKVETKTDRFKMKKFQDINSRVAGKSKKPGSSVKGGSSVGRMMTIDSGGKKGDGLNYGYGDMVTGNVKTPNEYSIGAIPNDAFAFDNAQTLQDVNYIQQDIKKQYPKTFIDPKQYLSGEPISDAGARDICAIKAQADQLQQVYDTKPQCICCKTFDS